MGWQDVEEIHPDLELYGDPADRMSKAPEAQVTLPFHIDVFVLEDRSFLSIEGCQVRLEFLNGRLWQIRFKCKDTDPDVIHRTLVNQYGFPLPGRSHHLSWKDEWTHIGLNPMSGQFVLGDRVRGKKMSMAAYGTLLKSQLEAQQQDGSEQPEQASETPEGSEASPEAQAGAAPSEATPPEQAPEVLPQETPEER
jgi:hypothetical protein